MNNKKYIRKNYITAADAEEKEYIMRTDYAAGAICL